MESITAKMHRIKENWLSRGHQIIDHEISSNSVQEKAKKSGTELVEPRQVHQEPIFAPKTELVEKMISVKVLMARLKDQVWDDKFVKNFCRINGADERRYKKLSRIIAKLVTYEETLSDPVGRASFTSIRSAAQPVMKHLDQHKRWNPAERWCIGETAIAAPADLGGDQQLRPRQHDGVRQADPAHHRKLKTHVKWVLCKG